MLSPSTRFLSFLGTRSVGVEPDTYSPTTNLVFSWGTNTSFADKQEALDALLNVLKKVGKPS